MNTGAITAFQASVSVSHTFWYFSGP